jgi:DNA-binding MurR/RpiR family transcriptional regulator
METDAGDSIQTVRYRPGEVARRLEIAPATLSNWSREFGDLLSARSHAADSASSSHRRYSHDDLQLLERAKELLAQHLTYDEVRRRLSERNGKRAVPITPPVHSPVDSMAEIAALRARLDKLPRKQYQLAQVLLNTPEMIMFGSVRELASQLDVNNATIIRFAQSLGYSGYQALQSALRQAYLPRAGLQPPRDTSGLDNPESAAEATFAQHQANLQLAQQHLLNADFDAISELLMHARRIIVAASGSSVVPGMLMVRLLRHVGLRGELVSEGEVEREIALYDAGPEDVVIGIGFWLTYRGVVEALALARRQGAKTIAITGSPTSPLRQVADHLLIAPAQGTAFSFSSVATIAVVEIIVSHIAARRPQRTAEVSQHLHDRYLEEHLLAPLLAPDEK